MNDSGIIITIAYPETIVRVSSEWTASHVYLLGIGKKNYLRAGHAALILIEKTTGSLEYFDFGRYVTPQPTGRVRSKLTDHELEVALKADLKGSTIKNIDEILTYLATHPQLTHGEGTMLASVCDEVDYNSAKNYINSLQTEGLIYYAAFGKKGSNCSRFVTDTLLASVSNKSIIKKLRRLKWFTPSTIGNVLISDTQNNIYKVTESGIISLFDSSKSRENRRLFMDRLKNHQSNLEGNLMPKKNQFHHQDAQWLSGIGGGAWFELQALSHTSKFRVKRISPYGNIDVDGIFQISESGFDSHLDYEIVPNSNCNFIHVKQRGITFRFDFLRKSEMINSGQKEHLI